MPVKGFGWAKVTLLVEPIGGGSGAVWLIAAVLTVAAGALLLARVSRWWMVGALAVVVSQAVIVTSWADAKVGTVANVVLAFAVVYGWASQGDAACTVPWADPWRPDQAVDDVHR